MFYYNGANQRFPLFERALEPKDCWTPSREDEDEDEDGEEADE